MKIFGWELNLRKASKKELSEIVAWNLHTGYRFTNSKSSAMALSAVYRCVDLISDSLAVLPFMTYTVDEQGFKQEAKTHPLYRILNLEPNENMTRFVFFKTLVSSVLLRGNAYAYIERNGSGDVEQLVYLPADQVSIEFIKDGFGISRKRYRVAGWRKLVEPKDMIHVLNFSYDGIVGVSTLEHARRSLAIATSSENHADSYFRSGGSITGVLNVDRPLNKEQRDRIYNTWNQRITESGGGGVAVLEADMKFQPIAISPKDSQLLESRLFNVSEICRFFSVSPVKAFDLSKSSYSTVEATQLQFLTDTLLPIITKFEQEFQRKLFNYIEQDGYRVEFDTTVILRTDKAALGNYLRTMFNIGGLTPNELRRENNLPPVENGDKPFVPVNMQLLNLVGQVAPDTINSQDTLNNDFNPDTNEP